MFMGFSAEKFDNAFRNDEDCYRYLEQLKWGKGFFCIKCGCRESNKGRTSHHRRCKKCDYDESVTADTLFHGMKLPILKAFRIMFRLTAKKKGMSTVELAFEVEVQQK